MKISGDLMRKKRKIDLIIETAFYIVLPIILVCLTVFVFVIRSTAAEVGIPNLPWAIGIPNINTIQQDLSPETIEQIRADYINMLASMGNDVSGNYTIFIGNVDNTIYQIVCTNLMTIDDTNFPQTMLYQNTGQHYVEYYYNVSTGTTSNGNFYGGWVNTWQIVPYQTFRTGSGYVLASAYDELYGSSDTLIWKKGATAQTVGVTDLPDIEDLDDPEIDDPEQPTVPPPPTWDNNKTPSENLGDLIKWLGSVMTSLITSLLNNLKTFFSNLFNNLKSWLQTIKDSIENGFKNLVDNLKSLFKPFFDNIQSAVDGIKTFVERITEIIEMFVDPFDLQDFQSTLNNSSAFQGLSSTITAIKNLLQNAFSTEEPDSLVLVMDLRNGFYNLGLCTIDFNIIKPFRNAIRGLICALIFFEVLFTIINALNNYIGGNSAKND